jgi:hypothetical protein
LVKQFWLKAAIKIHRPPLLTTINNQQLADMFDITDKVGDADSQHRPYFSALKQQ